MPWRAAALGLASVLALPSAGAWRLDRSWDVAPAASDFSVGFALLTAGDRQYVGYYDPQHRMTIAARALDSDEWRFQTLPTTVGWDSHNYITMALDDAGHLHVSGNMHADELVYFRTREAGDIATLERLPMTGELEDRTTYPKFLTNREGGLVFNYRHGGSGNGNHIYNLYDPATRTWKRMLDRPLLDGEGKRSAYPNGPVPGPDGCFHMIWVWRDTPDCSTNHHLGHARSPDLVHWESAFGEKIELPIRLDQQALWVDPAPSGGGMINGGCHLTFDSGGRPLIAYHKADENGHMQIHAARPEDGRWVVRQLTDWNKPVVFGGNGSMGFIGIRITGLEPAGPGVLGLGYRHRDYGSGRLYVDEASLRPAKAPKAVDPPLPRELDRLESTFPGMEIRRAGDLGDAPEKGVRYLLQWETVGVNRDKRPPAVPPGPGMLKLHKLVATSAGESLPE